MAHDILLIQAEEAGANSSFEVTSAGSEHEAKQRHIQRGLDASQAKKQARHPCGVERRVESRLIRT